jgi:colicin import membrane protein
MDCYMRSRSDPRRWFATLACALALMLAGVGGACAESATDDAPAGRSELERLRDYSGELLKEIETLRADLARSESARKAAEASLASISAAQKDARATQETFAKDEYRRVKELDEARSALEAAKADQAKLAARVAELEKERVKVDSLKSEVADRERALSDLVAERDRDAKRIAELTSQNEKRVDAERRMAEAEAEAKREHAAVAEREKEIAALKADRERPAAKPAPDEAKPRVDAVTEKAAERPADKRPGTLSSDDAAVAIAAQKQEIVKLMERVAELTARSKELAAENAKLRAAGGM